MYSLMRGRRSVEEMNGKLFSVEEKCYILKYDKVNYIETK